MANAFELKIVTPEGPAFSGGVQSARLPGVEGDFGVLANHAPLLAALRAGVLEVKEDFGSHRVFAVGEGFVEIESNEVSVLADFVNDAGDVDRKRAEQALERARQRLRRPDENVDVPRARAALHRAIARLKATQWL